VEAERYAAAGVNIAAADRTLALIKGAVRSTYTPEVVTDLGSFGGMFALDLARWREPVLVSSVDSVGTKVLVAGLAGRHRGIGFDMVHHAVNDIAVMGAEPLFFLDYLGTSRLDPEAAAEVIIGLADACRGVGCALVGGELAELPGMYQGSAYDLVGCIVGVVERSQAVDGRSVVAGDVLLGLPSVGLHTNGFSLARKVLLEEQGLSLDETPAGLGVPLGEALLAPHRCYLEPIRALRGAGLLKAAAHITGGGLMDNVPRVLPAGVGAYIQLGSWPANPLCDLICRLGAVPDAERFKTLNMGVGMVLVVGRERVGAARALVGECDEIGEIVAGAEGVVLVPA
jgi:phosphoribosylformylglycinamidine cyclo-ligase